MILDGHIHIYEGKPEPKAFMEKLHEAGISGAMLISMHPASETADRNVPPARERLENLFEWVDSNENLYPFFWIDPAEEDALSQVDMALDYGVKGFKVICNHFSCGDERAMPAFRAIAKAGKPILFHSGILWDGQASSRYQRPAEFEALLEIDGLKFALAHISWPWTDECIAVYGKFASALRLRPELSVEMFIDFTPGTPPIYRRDVFTKLFNAGYDVKNNIIFGSDGIANDYDSQWARDWIDRDSEIYNALELDQGTIDNIYSENLKRFVGLSG